MPVRGDVAHLIGALPAAEGTARGRDDQSADLGVGAGPQRLPDGGMLRVDGIDLVIAHLRAEKQVTACDDRFLVGERQLRASPQRRNGWFESDRARDAVQHQVGTGTGDGVDRLRPGLNLRVPSVPTSSSASCSARNGGLVIYGHLRHMMTCDLLCQKPHMRASGGQTGDGEPLRMPR